MEENLECPDQKTLLDHVAGRLDEAGHRQVELHLGACQRCSQAVEWIIANLVKGETDELAGGSSSTKTFPSHLAAQLKPQSDGPLNHEVFNYDILAPSSKKGTIGRLGKYDVYGVIGKGGMGVVFKAFDEQLRRPVAIKVLNRQLASNAVARRRFAREARAAANIKHENVITIYGVDESHNCPFLVMEFVGGCSLRDHIRRHRHLEPLEVAQLSQGIAAGLAAAHAQGVIHRDIKPSNIMLEEGGVRVKITDFGLARAAIDNVDLTSQGAAVGTAAYMSPEQVSGNRIDLRSDLFSLGCVMYAMVAGHSPFQGKNSLDIARKVAEFKPPPLEKTHEGTPPMLSEIVARLLEKDPDKRFQSATEVAEVLNRYLIVLNQTPTDEMSRVFRTSRLGGRSGRRWLPWVVTAAAVVLVAVLGTLLLWRGGGGLVGKGDGTVEPVPPGPEATGILSKITVGPSGADAASIADALARAGPGTEIRVKPGVYLEAVEISNAEQFRDLKLEGETGTDGARAVLRANVGGPPAIRIRGVSGVVVRGFQIETVLPEALSEDIRVPSAIAIEGRAAGITIEDIEYHQPDRPHVDPAVHITATPHTGQDNPILLRNCTISSPTGGQCVLIGGSEQQVQHVELQGNRFLGQGVLVLVQPGKETPVGDVTIEGNLFLGEVEEGERQTINGVNLDLVSQVSGRSVRITNNTFQDVRFWLGLVGTDPALVDALVCNNLILGSDGVEIGRFDQADSAAANWRGWESNWREHVAESDSTVTPEADAGTETPIYRVTFFRGMLEQGRSVARLATEKEQIDLLQRDKPSAANFLALPPESPLRDSGYGKEGLPSYIGARRPQETGQR